MINTTVSQPLSCIVINMINTSPGGRLPCISFSFAGGPSWPGPGHTPREWLPGLPLALFFFAGRGCIVINTSIPQPLESSE